MITTGTELTFEDLGTVYFVVRNTARHISARWRDGKVVCNVPAGVTHEQALRALGTMAPQLAGTRPTLTFFENQTLEFEGWRAVIVRAAIDRDRVIAYPSARTTTVEVPASFSFDAPDATARISSVLRMAAQAVAPQLLIPRARELAARTGRRPLGWKISRGQRTLGTCSHTGIISLSYMTAFLPGRLRDFVICHELAHLSEMNHGSDFHNICNRYCGGLEHELAAELRAYRWPILRK